MLALVVAAGVGLAVQSRVNGAFAVRVGGGGAAPVLAALASFTVGTAVVAAGTAASRPARLALRGPWRGRVRWWMCTGGLGGALAVGAGALAVPVLGVALFSVGLVAGQTAGGLLVDRWGLGPGGRRPLTWPRVAGAALAVVAVGWGALGVRTEPGSWWLLLGVAGAGLATAVQAAVNGRLTAALGDARAASLVSFGGGTALLAGLSVVLLAAAGGPPLDLPPLALWSGGLPGAAYVTLAAAVVSRVGVLRLTLSVVAGQLAGSVLLDVAAPVPGRGLTVAAAGGALLVFAAVLVAGRPARPQRVPRPSPEEVR